MWCLPVNKYSLNSDPDMDHIAKRQLTGWSHIWEFVVVVNTLGGKLQKPQIIYYLVGFFCCCCCCFYFVFFVLTSFRSLKPTYDTNNRDCIFLKKSRTQWIDWTAWGHTANSMKVIFTVPVDSLPSHFCSFKQTFVQIQLLNPWSHLWLPSEESMGPEV